jgi:DNA adenine methylase
MNTDFVDVMAAYNSPNNFIFLDPPYHGCFNDYGATFQDADFHRLFVAFKTNKSRCLLIVADTELTRRLFSAYIAEEYFVRYSASDKRQIHLVIKNY